MNLKKFGFIRFFSVVNKSVENRLDLVFLKHKLLKKDFFIHVQNSKGFSHFGFFFFPFKQLQLGDNEKRKL